MCIFFTLIFGRVLLSVRRGEGTKLRLIRERCFAALKSDRLSSKNPKPLPLVYEYTSNPTHFLYDILNHFFLFDCFFFTLLKDKKTTLRWQHFLSDSLSWTPLRSCRLISHRCPSLKTCSCPSCQNSGAWVRSTVWSLAAEERALLLSRYRKTAAWGIPRASVWNVRKESDEKRWRVQNLSLTAKCTRWLERHQGRENASSTLQGETFQGVQGKYNIYLTRTLAAGIFYLFVCFFKKRFYNLHISLNVALILILFVLGKQRKQRFILLTLTARFMGFFLIDSFLTRGGGWAGNPRSQLLFTFSL